MQAGIHKQNRRIQKSKGATAKKVMNSKYTQALSTFITLIIVIILPIGECIKCFQCSSTEDQRKPTGVWSEDHYTQNRDAYYSFFLIRFAKKSYITMG